MKDNGWDNPLIELYAKVVLDMLLDVVQLAWKSSDDKVVPGLCTIELNYFDFPVVYPSFIFPVGRVLHSYSFVDFAPVTWIIMERKFQFQDATNSKRLILWNFNRILFFDNGTSLQVHSQKSNIAELTVGHLTRLMSQVQDSCDIHII